MKLARSLVLIFLILELYLFLYLDGFWVCCNWFWLFFNKNYYNFEILALDTHCIATTTFWFLHYLKLIYFLLFVSSKGQMSVRRVCKTLKHANFKYNSTKKNYTNKRFAQLNSSFKSGSIKISFLKYKKRNFCILVKMSYK